MAKTEIIQSNDQSNENLCKNLDVKIEQVMPVESFRYCSSQTALFKLTYFKRK